MLFMYFMVNFRVAVNGYLFSFAFFVVLNICVYLCLSVVLVFV